MNAPLPSVANATAGITAAVVAGPAAAVLPNAATRRWIAVVVFLAAAVLGMPLWDPLTGR